MPTDPTWIDTITTTTIVSLEKYNAIQSKLYEIMGSSWYGSKKIQSHTLSSSNQPNIKLQDWQSLMYDINKVWVHQNGESSSLIHIYDNPGLRITADLVNTEINYVNLIYNNSSTVASNQLIANVDNATSERTTDWNSSLVHEVEYEWDSASEVFSFFTLGGYVKGTLAFERPSLTPSVDDGRWFIKLLPAAIDALELTDNQFHLSDWQSLSVGSIKKRTLAEITEANDAGIINPDNISIVYTKQDEKTLRAKIELYTDSRYYDTDPEVITVIQVPVTSVFNIYESIGDDNIGTGIRSPEFITTPIHQFSESITIPVEKRIISITQPAVFTGLTTSTSTSNILYIKNRGNAEVSINNITQISGAGGTLVTSPTSAVISIGASKEFTLSYNTGDNPGTYYFNNEISGNMDSGSTKFLTQLTTTPWPFTYTISRTQINSTITEATPVSFSLELIPGTFQYISQSEIKFVESDNGFSLATPAGYKLDKGDATHFTVTFSPKGLAPNVYTAIIGINCRGLYKYVYFSIDSQFPLDGNLGSWISARGYDNAVVGMSYDVIGGIRYLTVGIGAGAGTDYQLADYNGLSVKSLGTGTTADPMFVPGIDPTYQMVVFKQPEYSYHQDTSLRRKLIWSEPRPQSTYPELTWQTRQYYFETAVATKCNLRASVDNRGKVSINGSTIASWGSDTGAYASFTTATFTSIAGRNIIKIEFYNASYPDEREEAWHHISEDENPGNIAVEIYNQATQTIIWDTSMVARADSDTGYRFWQEVYRVPLKSNQKEETLYLNHYCVKDVVAVSNHAEGKKWGDYFGARVAKTDTLPALDNAGLFTIKNDGYGNLKIITNDWNAQTPKYSSWPDTDGSGGGSPANLALTMRNLRLCFYYSTFWDSNATTNDVRRYTNLENPVLNRTKFFTGFKRTGEVTYTVVDTPKWNFNSKNP